MIAAQQHVEQLIDSGTSLTLVEDYIDREQLPDDMKAALWLYAYCSLSRARVRHETGLILRDLAILNAVPLLDG